MPMNAQQQQMPNF
jgi:tetratricopeptide (TPR) repeat protein